MRACTLLLSFVFLCAASSYAAQQSVSPQSCASLDVQRDSQALTAVQQAVKALGGLTAKSVTAAITQAAVTSLNSQSPSGTVTWEDDFSGPSYEFRTTFQTDTWTRVFSSGHGSPGQIDIDGKPHKLQGHVASAALPYYLPVIILARDLADSTRNIKLIGAETVSGKQALHVRITSDCDPIQKLLSLQDWYLDPLSFLPLRVEYLVPNTVDITDVYVSSVDYADYRNSNGLMIPYTDVVSERGKPTCSIQVTSIQINPVTNPADFDIPDAATDVAGGAL
jgi:hypothetical protein